MISFSPALLITLLVSGLFFVSILCFKTVEASPDISGIIGSDTVWTQANSPYFFSGNVLVDNGITLTIEAGVTVNIDEYYLMVNGTLRGQGTETEKIQFNGGEIIFTQYSNGWNEQASFGCIIENANLTTSISSDVPLKLTNVNANAPISAVGSSIVSYSSLTAELSVGNSSIVSHCSLSAETSVGDLSTVTDNTITEDVVTGSLSTIANTNINGSVFSRSSSIVNNTITGTIRIINTNSAGSEIRNNTIRGGGAHWYYGLAPFPRYATHPYTVIDVSEGTVAISNNTIISYNLYSQLPESEFDGGYGITTQVTCIADIHNNVISGGFVRGINVVGSATIQDNFIINNSGGIAIGKSHYDYELIVSDGELTIRDNILVNNSIGIGGPAVNGYSSGDSAATKARKVTIESNLIVGSQTGVGVGLKDVNSNIQKNTITNYSVAVTLTSCPSATINFNNIQNCTKSIMLTDTIANIDATNNWWGTTDTEAIAQTIYDYYDDFYLGKVNFTPFLTEPTPEAMSTELPDLPEFPSWIILPLCLLSTIVAVFLRTRLRIK
jgi:hypothetical protein